MLWKKGEHATEVTKWVVIPTICFLLCDSNAYLCSRQYFVSIIRLVVFYNISDTASASGNVMAVYIMYCKDPTSM